MQVSMVVRLTRQGINITLTLVLCGVQMGQGYEGTGELDTSIVGMRWLLGGDQSEPHVPSGTEGPAGAEHHKLWRR